MPAPFFTKNPGEFTRLEGVYIFEQNPPAFIQGIFLGVVGVAGETLRGPINTPVEITSGAEFEAVFGGRSYENSNTSVNKVREFFMNKPFGNRVVVRAAAAGVLPAMADDAGAFITVAASSPGAWGNDLSFDISAPTSGDANQFNLTVKHLGGTTTYINLDVSVGNDNLLDVIGSDLSNLVAVTKNTDGVPAVTAASVPLVGGADGTIAATDYTAVNGPLEQVANYPGVALVAAADVSNLPVADISGVHTTIKLLADASSDRMFFMWTGDHNMSRTDAEDWVAGTHASNTQSLRSDRIVFVYNSTNTFDRELGALVTTPPHSFLMSVMSQTDVDINPGEEASKDYTGAIASVQDNAISREAYISLREAGIAAWERDFDGSHLIVSAVTTSLELGREDITRRRMADFLTISSARRLRFYIKKKNTITNRALMLGELEAFLAQLQDEERVVEEYEILSQGLNTKQSRGKGLECILMRVRLVGHMKHIVLKTEIGSTVIITEEN